MNGGLSQGLPFGLSARGNVDYFTDVTTQQLYNNNFYDATNSTRRYAGGVSGAWRGPGGQRHRSPHRDIRQPTVLVGERRRAPG